jgi:hypothetical protein
MSAFVGSSIKEWSTAKTQLKNSPGYLHVSGKRAIKAGLSVVEIRAITLKTSVPKWEWGTNSLPL